jgi:hypothetical protein
MLRSLLLLPVVATATLLHAQTYFHLQQVQVVPAEPTTSDQVEVHLIGQLSDPGAQVQVPGLTVVGHVVDITLTAGSSGGLAVLVPHIEVVQVGTLPAGAYTIVMNAASSGVNDAAPAEEHLFTVSAGGAPCHELQIEVQWHPFTDTAVVVHVTNPSAELFDYPNFILFDDQGDTLAIETVNFFGIATESWHMLSVVDGAVLSNDLNGTLELWTGFTTTLACTWNGPFALCPPPFCAPVHPGIMNMGGALVLGAFTYMVHDAGGTLVAEGDWDLTEAVQMAYDTLCLPPGQYTMRVVPHQASTGGAAVFTVAAPGWVQGPMALVYQSEENTMPFDFFGACVDVGQSIHEPAPDPLRAAPVRGGLWVHRTDQRPLGELWLFDAQGRALYHATTASARVHVPVSGPGVYVVRTQGHALRVVAGVQ